MSAPVLSWLFTAQGKPESVPCPAILAMRESTIHRRRQVASAQLEHQNKDPYTQPSEPILFPKLRIYFADFPYLLLFYGPVAGKLGDLKGFSQFAVNSP